MFFSKFEKKHSFHVKTIFIENCGELKPDEPWNIHENDGTEDKYPPWPDDWEAGAIENFSDVEKAINVIKKSGNYHFSGNNFIDSERKYVKCLRYIDWYLYQKKSNKIIENMRIILMINLAAVKLNRHKYKEVVNLCNAVLKVDPVNAKAFYRRARARLGMKEYDSALKDLKIAASFYPNDTNVLITLQRTKQLKLNYLKKEKHAYSKLFS